MIGTKKNLLIGGGVGRGLCYPLRKMRKSQVQYPFYNKIIHNFIFSMIDIQIFTHGSEK